MSSIEQLSIRGIRSFSPQYEEKIMFMKPLTLILGQNGAGKTTIIECLRTMTAGSMPPHTNNGKTFLHDPRISNQPETKAAIKLKFSTTKGKVVFALRSFQLLNKKQKQEFKKLEQVLKTTDERGNEVSINKNCAEMDRQVPLLMGVSNAILENVVFCHQDESLWPFSDQANLKKIFDEIFDTTKYTKALTELRATSKKYSKYAREFKQELDLTVKDFEQFTKIKANITQYESKINDVQTKLEIGANLKNQLQNEIRMLRQQEDDLRPIAEDLGVTTQRLAEKQQDLRELQKKLNPDGLNQQQLLEKEKEVMRLKNNYEQEMQRLTQLQQECSDQVQQTQQEILKSKGSIQQLENKLASNTAFVEDQQTQINVFTTQLRSDLQARQIYLPDDQIKVADLQALLQSEILDRDSITQQLSNLKRQQQDQVRQIELQQSSESTKSDMLKSNLKMTLKQIAEIQSEFQQKDQQIDELQTTAQQLSQLDKQIMDLRRQMQQMIQDTDSMSQESNVDFDPESLSKCPKVVQLQSLEQELQSKLQEAEQQQVQLQQLEINNSTELKKLQTDSESLHQIQVLHQEFDKQAAIVQPVLLKLGVIKDNITAQSDFQAIQTEIAECFQNQAIDLALKTLDELKVKMGGNETTTTLTQVLKQIDELVALEARKNETVGTVSRLLRFSKEKSQCFMCKQSASASTLQLMEKNFPVETQRTKIEEQINKKREDLQSSFESACVGHSNDKVLKLIADREKNLAKIKKKTAKFDQKLICQQLIQLQVLARQITERKKPNWQSELRSCNRYLQQKHQTCKSTAEQLALVATNVQQLKQHLNLVSEQKTTLQNQFYQIHMQHNQLQTQKYRLLSKQKKQTFNSGSAKAELMKDELMKLTQKESYLKVQIEQLDEHITSLSVSLADACQKDTKVIERLELRISTKNENIDMIQKALLEMTNLELLFQKNELPRTQIESIMQQIAAIGKDQVYQEFMLRSFEAKLKDVTQQINSKPMTDKIVEMFAHYRQLQSEIEQKSKMAAILSGKLAGRADRQVKLAELQQTLQQKQSEWSNLQGQIISQKESLKAFKIELLEPKYKDIEKRLLDLNVKYHLTKDISTEVQDKHDALEEALMNYHHEKMKEINRTLSDFWKITYKGTDIETIMIKTDAEKTEMNQRLRSYNYRIVLKTYDNCELDMKGRCSAGQKVLSSIIIRLSLAETFCANCGILALDEPTTNLDIDNIEGLAQALLDIIESRKNSQSFQLIIITHDEQFVQMIGHQHTESIWKVTRDQNQFSRIKKEPISGIL